MRLVFVSDGWFPNPIQFDALGLINIISLGQKRISVVSTVASLNLLVWQVYARFIPFIGLVSSTDQMSVTVFWRDVDIP